MIGEGVAVGRLFGIEIRVSITWVVVIALIVLIGAEQAAVTAPDLSLAARWLVGGAVAAGFFVSVLAHELAHTLVARRHGVATTSIVLGFIGGLAPLSIEASRPSAELAIAVAGPAVSIVLGVALIVLGVLAGMAPALGAVAGGLIVVGALNAILGVLSLLPGLPLDGGRVVRAIAWRQTGDPDRAARLTARIGRVTGWSTMGVGVALALMDRTTEGLLALALGWFLSTGARTLERRLGLERLLRGVPVRDAMEADVPFVGPHLTVDTFADRYEGENGLRAIPVVDDDRVVGVVGVRRLQRLGRKRFSTTRAADIMATPPGAPILSPGDDLWTALELVNESGLDGLAVADEGHLAGMLTRRAVTAVIRARLAAHEAAGGRG